MEFFVFNKVATFRFFVYAIVGSMFCGLTGARIWFHLWFYENVDAPPRFLVPMVWSDGESSYVRAEFEMFLIVFGVCLSMVLTTGFVYMAIRLFHGVAPRRRHLGTRPEGLR